MKIWDKPQISNLSIDSTYTLYEDECYWDGSITLGLGNEEYRDPNNKPANHPNWVWCDFHKMWHPKVHTGSGDESIIPGIS